MNLLLEMIREAGAVQVVDWTLFQKIKKNSFLIQVPTNAHVTEVWVKWSDTVVRHTFDIQGKLTDMNAAVYGSGE